MHLFDSNDAAFYVREKIDSKEWWVIVNGDHLNTVIEDRYYDNENSDQFELIIGYTPSGFISIALAHKNCMTAAQLAECAKESGFEQELGQLTEALKTKDVLFPNKTVEEGMLVTMAFATFLAPAEVDG